MRSIPHQRKVVGADAGLEGAVAGVVGMKESPAYPLHSAADEKSAVVIRDDPGVLDQRVPEFEEPAPNDLDQAWRRSIWLSSCFGGTIPCRRLKPAFRAKVGRIPTRTLRLIRIGNPRSHTPPF